MLVVDMIMVMIMVVIVRLRMRVRDSRVRGGMAVMMMPRTVMIVRVMVVTGMQRSGVGQDRRKPRPGSAVR